MGSAEGTQSIRRATEVLRVVARIQRSGATLSKVTRATGLNRSTAFRILKSLVEERLLESDADHSRYYLGPLAFELGLAASGSRDLIERWRGRIDRLNRATGLTTYLMGRSDFDAVCLNAMDGSTVVRAVPVVTGQRLPLGVGAGSLAILASLPDGEVEAIIEANASKIALLAEGRLTTPILRERIARTRAQGYALSQESVAKGVLGLGLVVSRPTDVTALAVSVSMAGSELEPTEQARLIAKVREITASES
jgi:DNA-binding IclR family transcriptional regulator